MLAGLSGLCLVTVCSRSVTRNQPLLRISREKGTFTSMLSGPNLKLFGYGRGTRLMLDECSNKNKVASRNHRMSDSCPSG